MSGGNANWGWSFGYCGENKYWSGGAMMPNGALLTDT
jgi:hypothetical protein